MELEFQELEFHKKQHGKFKGYFFKEPELHGKLEFHKLEFKKSKKLLNISQTVINLYIFSNSNIWPFSKSIFKFPKKVTARI